MNRDTADAIAEAILKALPQSVIDSIDLTAEDVRYISDVADRVRDGRLTREQADAMVDAYGKMKGTKLAADRKAEAAYEYQKEASEGEFSEETTGWVDLTEKVQGALRESGEPGMADGLVKVLANPEGIIQQEQGTEAAFGVSTKKWFNMDALNDYEQQLMARALELACKAEGLID